MPWHETKIMDKPERFLYSHMAKLDLLWSLNSTNDNFQMSDVLAQYALCISLLWSIKSIIFLEVSMLNPIDTRVGWLTSNSQHWILWLSSTQCVTGDFFLFHFIYTCNEQIGLKLALTGIWHLILLRVAWCKHL